MKNRKIKYIKQKDSMQCGVASLAMVCNYFGRTYTTDFLSKICYATNEGVSMLGISEAASKIGLETITSYVAPTDLLRKDVELPAILHWRQNHFVVLYKINKKYFYIADPAKGLLKYSYVEFLDKWLSTNLDNQEKGIAMFLEPTPYFYDNKLDSSSRKSSFVFLKKYITTYRNFFTNIILGLALGCLLQLIMPFLTQWIVDIGIKHKDIQFIWLILLGELLIIVGRTVTDFIRRWMLLHISMRINISLVSDFFIKLLKLPMSFFDTKLMGDLLQRIGDHGRVQSFLTNQVLG